MPRVIFLLICLSWCGQAAFAQPKENRVALVIGNSAYKESPLKNPANDAEDMARVLQSVGFKVILKRNASTREMRQAIRDFGVELRRSQVGLFYFAGHGVQVKGNNYLMPVGADIQGEADAEDLAIDANYALRTMEEAQVKVSIVILDACRNNPFSRNFRSATRGLAQMSSATGSVVAFSTAPGAVAADGDGRNGTYTKHLLANLRDGDPDIAKVFQRTRAGVVKETGGKQTPWESTSLIGDFHFRSQVGSIAPATTSDPTTNDRAFWESVKDTKNPEELKHYLEQFPKGLFAALARTRIGALEQAAGSASEASNARITAEKAAAAQKAATEKADMERAAAERAEKERIAAERAEAEKAERERTAAERATAARVAAEKAVAEKTAADRAAMERAAAEKIEKERVAATRAAAEKAAAGRAAMERVAAQKIELERVAAERLAAEKAASEKAAADRAASERAAAQKIEMERVAAEKVAAVTLASIAPLTADRATAENATAVSNTNVPSSGTPIVPPSHVAPVIVASTPAAASVFQKKYPQSWLYQEFARGSGYISVAGQSVLGQVVLKKRGGKLVLTVEMPYGGQFSGYNPCLRQELETTITETETTTTIVAIPVVRGCAEYRFVIRNDGTGGQRFVKNGSDWVWDGLDRVLTAIK